MHTNKYEGDLFKATKNIQYDYLLNFSRLFLLFVHTVYSA